MADYLTTSADLRRAVWSALDSGQLNQEELQTIVTEAIQEWSPSYEQREVNPGKRKLKKELKPKFRQENTKQRGW